MVQSFIRFYEFKEYPFHFGENTIEGEIECTMGSTILCRRDQEWGGNPTFYPFSSKNCEIEEIDPRGQALGVPGPQTSINRWNGLVFVLTTTMSFWNLVCLSFSTVSYYSDCGSRIFRNGGRGGGSNLLFRPFSPAPWSANGFWHVPYRNTTVKYSSTNSKIKQTATKGENFYLQNTC